MFQSLRSVANYYLRFNPYFRKHLYQVLAQKEWDAAQLREAQNERFLALVRQAVRYSPFYQQRYAAYGIRANDVQSLDDLARLPIITKQDVRNHRREIYTGWRWLRTTGRTSGSSGTPLTVYRDYASTVREGAYLWAQRALFGLQIGNRIVSLRGNLDRTRTHYYDRWTRCLYLSSYHLREERADWYYQQLRQFRPYAILAYPSSVEILANFLLRNGQELSVPYVFTSSEQVYNYQRAKIERAFNTRVVDWYGNAERTIALEQRPDGHYYELPLYSVNEYEADRILTTGLLSANFPLIRYQVDDIITPEPGQHSFRVAAITGRHDDLLHLPDGTQVGRIGVAFLDIKGLELAQFHQGANGEVTLCLVVTPHFDRASLAKIQDKLRQLAGEQFTYRIVYVSPQEIVRTAAGKFKLVISEFVAYQDQGVSTIS